MLRYFPEELEPLIGERVEDEWITGVLDNPHRFPVLGQDLLDRVGDLGPCSPHFHAILIDDRLGCVVLRAQLLELDLLDFIEEFEQGVGGAVFLV